MRYWARTALVVVVSTPYACGSSTSTPPRSTSTSTTTTAAYQTVTSAQRLHWSQTATGDAEMASIRFAIYVDGSRSDLAGAACTSNGTPGSYDCSAPLPAMTAGHHTLQLASNYFGRNEPESLSPVLEVVFAIREPEPLPFDGGPL